MTADCAKAPLSVPTPLDGFRGRWRVGVCGGVGLGGEGVKIDLRPRLTVAGYLGCG